MILYLRSCKVESSETYVKQLKSESSEIHVDKFSTLQTQSHAIMDIAYHSDHQVDTNQEKHDATPPTNISDDTLIAILGGVTDKTKVANSRTITKEINRTNPSRSHIRSRLEVSLSTIRHKQI